MSEISNLNFESALYSASETLSLGENHRFSLASWDAGHLVSSDWRKSFSRHAQTVSKIIVNSPFMIPSCQRKIDTTEVVSVRDIDPHESPQPLAIEWCSVLLGSEGVMLSPRFQSYLWSPACFEHTYFTKHSNSELAVQCLTHRARGDRYVTGHFCKTGHFYERDFKKWLVIFPTTCVILVIDFRSSRARGLKVSMTKPYTSSVLRSFLWAHTKIYEQLQQQTLMWL